MSSATFVGNADSSGPPGFCVAPPPPPPPPPVPNQIPAMKINTAETPMSRRSLVKNNDHYEPPAAIQNAMMTKDKKPFTYTPGMGGKLDLSQIRSPRMARRVAKNANDEGIEGPPKSPLASEQSRPTSTATNLFVQPQVAVPVFPTTPTLVSQVTRTPQVNRVPSNAMEKNIESTRPTVRIEQKLPSQPATPDTPTTPPQITLAKAPTPWLQNKNKPQDNLPEWAKRNTMNGSSSTYSPPESPAALQVIQLPLTRPTQQEVVHHAKSVQQPTERIIPLRVEDRPSVFSAKNEPGHHQFKQSSPHHQQRWGQSAGSSQSPSLPINKVISDSTKAQQTSSSSGTYIVPITVEGNDNKTTTIIHNPYQPSVIVQNQINKNVQRTPITVQPESGPVQSRSFRVLQKITDTDGDDIDNEQLRKLQLTEDDKLLMNKFKEQVDGENYLHQEEDPRYRGAAIPSRAFRYLQNMTDSNEFPVNSNAVPRAVNSALKRQNRNSRIFEETQANLPPSEQQVQEPKKYTGSAIPSRSFKMLQAMTTPEGVAKQENRQADFTYQVETSMMPQGNQHGVFIPQYPHQPIYWAYCPVSYPSSPSHQINTHLHYHPTNNNNMNNTPPIQSDRPDTNASPLTNNFIPYVLYPFCNQNFYTPISNNMLPQIPKTLSNNSTIQPIWFGSINEIKDNKHNSTPSTETNSNQIEGDSHHFYHNNQDNMEKNLNKIINTSTKNSGKNSMNITDEETTNQLTKPNDHNDVVRSTNNENIETDGNEVSSDDISESSSVDNTRKENDIDGTNDNDNYSSNSDSDSDSYLAYSTGLNPHKNDEDNLPMLNNYSEDRENTDCESYIDEEEDEENLATFTVNNDLLSDTTNKTDLINCEDIIRKEEEQSGDIVDADENETTINVRLPLRFKCAIVDTDGGSNKINTENSNIELINDNTKNIFSNNSESNDDICVNLKIPNEINTSVNFTLKKNFTAKRPESWCPETQTRDYWTCKTIVKCNRTESPTKFCLRETEISEESIINNEHEKDDKEITSTDNDVNKNIIREIPQFEVTIEEESKSKLENNEEFSLSDECEKNKDLLTVQNSREETDDDDSGVTSDMSRLLSEVDTDSDCGASLRKVNAYKRTQTHSRLFKLLNGDLVFTDELSDTPSKVNGKNHLNLPLKQSNEFNYDNSNYSSGISSPNYSPVHDPPAWKQLHNPVIAKPINMITKDRYFKTWKRSKESSTNPVSSFVHKIMETKSSTQSWPYKSNILCPRIKSSKSVPKVLQNRMKK